MSSLAANALIILLHGVGSNGNDLLPLSNVLAEGLPGAIFVSPDAPERSSFGSGYQWFSVAGVTEDNRSGRIRDARAAFDATISAIIEKNGFAGRLDRVALVGFSQGTIMALDALASGRWPVGAVVGFSGRLAASLALAPLLATPVLLIHGSADTVIPASESTRAAATLQQLGVSIETMIIQGLPHTISADGAARAQAFLAKVLLGAGAGDAE